ncbi:sulfite exporter TauE/SafE family protein [Enhygromyxa salina]|uniref:sulfite exporter TauE/SafE family protein n=1 Tax=Enhygromyxa salina TaxID=215803 RepID=UPI0015E70271|nr:sulfite exporter TauE/SafE family protein [Enhygromyxa salina]
MFGPQAGAAAIDPALVWLVAAALVSGIMAYVGAMVGLVLGQFRLPLLVVALGSAPAAAASNLAISSLGAGTGAFAHAREGRVELRLLLSIGVPSAIAAYVSSRSVEKLEAWWIEAVIGATLLISALPLTRRAMKIHRSSATTSSPADPSPAKSSPAKSDLPGGDAPPGATDSPAEPPRLRGGLLALEVLIGVALGALSGVVGLLLGTLRLPAMLRLGVSAPKAAGTNMAIGFFTGVAGALGAIGSGRVSLLAFATVGGATFVGAWLGAKRTKSLPTARHLALIAIVLVAVGVWLISKAIAGR